MGKKLEQIRELISPFENRIKSVEAETLLEATGYHILGLAVCAIRGAVIGYTIGAFASGFDKTSSLAGAAIGMTLDVTQDALRKLNWTAMRRNNLQEYQNNIREWKNILRINYGRYAD